MNLIFPPNIFSELIAGCLKPEFRKSIIYKPSALISNDIKSTENSLGLIPTLDLLRNEDLFVSKEYGISFESSLCNSYIYFKPGQKKIDQLSLLGDVSSLEVILSKILFKEIYDSDIKIEILTDDHQLENKNLILVGKKNFEGDRFLSGLSFSEEVIESLSLPFVNYVFASKERKLIEDLNTKLKRIEYLVYESIEDNKFPDYFSSTEREYFKANISSLVIEFAPNDIDGIDQLLRLPYFHGIINDIVEVKFV